MAPFELVSVDLPAVILWLGQAGLAAVAIFPGDAMRLIHHAGGLRWGMSL